MTSDFVLREEGTENEHIVRGLGEEENDGDTQLLFHVFPVNEGDLTYEDSSVEDMAGRVLGQPAPRDSFEEAKEWYERQ